MSTSIADQLRQMLEERAAQAPGIVPGYKSALSTAAGQDQQSIDQLRGIYSDPSKFEHSKIGALGLGLMQGTNSGRFTENMYNGLAAATDAQYYNQAANLSREEKLAKLGALEAQLTRQKAQDTLGAYDTSGKVITNMQGDQQTMADLQLQQHPMGTRPLGMNEQGPEAPDQDPFRRAQMIYNDYHTNPGKYAGPEGQSIVKDAVDLIKNERTNKRYESVAAARQHPTNTLSPPEQRRISSRLKAYDEAADAGRALQQQTTLLKGSRDKIDYEGAPFATARANLTGWLSQSGADGQAVQSNATNFKLDLSGKLKGAISDKEGVMLNNATPGLDMADAAADPIIKGYNATGQRAIEHAKFMKEWFHANNSDYGADEAWDQYINDNPIVSTDQNGALTINEGNIGNWQNYVQQPDGQQQGQQQGGSADWANRDPSEVLGTGGDGQDITVGDILQTAEDNNMTPEQVVERLRSGQ
jgi:hypothetical protein